MHESSLMAGLLTGIEKAARAGGGGRVTAVHVTIGALAGISAEHFAEHFHMATKGTGAEGAKLHVTVSDDFLSADAQSIRMESIEVEAPETGS
jgi:hydrogenase nickel incorporation protein HypA/HybF